VKREKYVAIIGLIGVAIPAVTIATRSVFATWWLEHDYWAIIYLLFVRLFCPIVIALGPLLGNITEHNSKFFIVTAVAGLINGSLYGSLAIITSLRNRRINMLSLILTTIVVLVYWVYTTLQYWSILF